MLEVEKQTGETPNTLLTKPKLHTWVEWYWDAFWMLDTGRQVYQGSLGSIPLSEVHAYLEIFGIVEIETKLLFIKTIRALDSVYVKLQNKKIVLKIEQDRKAAESERLSGRRN